MKVSVILLAVLAAVAAEPSRGSERISGGSLATISMYPFGAAVMAQMGNIVLQTCGGAIINNRSVLSAAHCFDIRVARDMSLRLGSSFAHSGGIVYNVARIINHPDYNVATIDSDIAIVHSTAAFAFNNNVRAGSIAGPNYNVPDNAGLWAIGWGNTNDAGNPSEQLRHVQIFSVNQNLCSERWSPFPITANMLCAGVLDNIGGIGTCQRDSGGPLIHNNVIVGVTSFGSFRCGGDGFRPEGYARVSRFTSWIQSNA